MIKIGEFAKLGCVSIKTLRHYDRLNLLHPAHTDNYSGYRYYELSQLQRLNEILLFKLMGFSLENIEALLMHRTSEEVSEMLTLQEGALREQQAEISERLLWLKTSRNEIIHAQDALTSLVILKQQPALELVALSDTVSLSERNLHRKAVTQLLQRLNTLLPGSQQSHKQPYWAVIECGQADEEVDAQCIEVGLPAVLDDLTTPLKRRIIPARENVLSLLYDPAHYPAEEARLALFEWSQRRAYHFDGPFIELHYQDSENQLIEIQRQVAHSLPPQLTNNNKRKKIMEVTIKKLPARLYIGKTRQFTMETTELIAKFWDEINANMAPIEPLLIPYGQPGAHSLGLCWNVNEDGKFNYAPAFPLKDNTVTDIPAGYEVILVPEQDYVVVPAPGAKDNIGKAYGYAFETWLPQQTEWEHDKGKPDFEWYDENFNGFGEDSVLWIYIPIRKKD